MRERGGGAVGCSGQVITESKAALARLSIGELRYHAGEIHGIRNASLLSRADLVERLCKHFLVSHGVDIEGGQQLQQHGVQAVQRAGQLGEMRGLVLERQRGEHGRIQLQLEHGGDGEEDEDEDVDAETTEHQFILEADESEGVEEECDYSILADSGTLVGTRTQMRDGVGVTGFSPGDAGDAVDSECEDRELVVEVLHRDRDSRPREKERPPCQAFVIAKSVKELRDLGRDMLRIHAENHGIEYAAKLRMSELVREMIQHYNGVHRAGLEVSKLDMLKLNMLELKKIKVDVREKTPPPDTSKMVPKNVVPIEEQVHHVYEKRPDVCTVDIIVTNLKDMLALGTSILRPEASKHRVCNSSRKQKLQVVEELWEHYLKFHLKGSEGGMVGVSAEERMEISQHELLSANSHQEEFIIVAEEDIVAGEDIHTAGTEEVTA